MAFSIQKTVRYILLTLRFPRDKETIDRSILSIKSGATLSGPNLWVLVAAIFIASLGLNTNSTAVIIGAMLISPLMGPIIGFGLGLGTEDIELVKKSVRNFIMMVFMSVATSTLFFLVSPLKEAGSELLGRTSPTVYDVFIAFFGGFAGIVASSSALQKSNVIPGVAIATALMPPLCTMGYGLSTLNLEYIFGAFYLFVINCVFISIATYLLVTLLKYPHVNVAESGRRKRINLIISGIIILMILPSIYITYHIVKKHTDKKRAEEFVNKELNDHNHLVISTKFDYKPAGSSLEMVTVGETYDSLELAALQEKMKDYGLNNCRLSIYQGPDNQKEVLGVFNTINSDMEVQKLSMKELYIRLDSVKRGLNGGLLPDSLQMKVARELYSSDSLLQRLSLQRNYAYNPRDAKRDTLWKVLVSYSKEPLPPHQAALLEWLKLRLKSPYVQLVLQ